MASIYGYGAYVPRFRIKTEEIARVWGEDPRSIKSGLGIEEKSVAGEDEDTTTISAEAARQAVVMAGIKPAEIGAVHVGTESKPYAVKPSSTTVAAAVGCEGSTSAADLEFACKAGTEAIQVCMGRVDSGMVKYGLAIGADTAQSRPGDALEYSASSGGAAFIIGKDGEDALAKIEASHSFVTDTPDFWRRPHEFYPQHAGRFTAEPAYFKHVIGAAKGLFQKTGLALKDFDYAVFHMPNGKFPSRAAKILGFKDEQIKPGFVVPKIGNTYAGCSPLGLAATLDEVEPDKRILVVSFGSGAGSDAFSIMTLKPLVERRKKKEKIWDIINNRKIYLDYAAYSRFRRKIIF